MTKVLGSGFALALIAVCGAYLLAGGGPASAPSATGVAAEGAGVSSAVSSAVSEDDQLAREAVRQMAQYLENAPDHVVRELAGAGGPGPRPGGAAVETAAQDATQSGVDKVGALERQIAGHYSESGAGLLIRRYVALSLAGVDTDYRADLSRTRLINDLMQDAIAAAADLQAALRALPQDPVSGTAERVALIELAAHVGSNELALPQVESILMAEIGRPWSSADSATESGNGFDRLVDSYTMLVADPAKQVQFLRAGIEAQEDADIRHALESRLAHYAQ